MFAFSSLLLATVSASSISASTPNTGTLHLESPWYGPVAVPATLSQDGAASILESQTGLANLWDNPNIALDIRCADSCEAELVGFDSEISIERTDTGFSGEIRGGSFSGRFSFNIGEQVAANVDYRALAQEIHVTLEQNAYHPHAMQSESAEAFLSSLIEISASVESDLDMLYAMDQLWNECNPFSHVRLSKARMPAIQLAEFVDGMEVGYEAARLEIDDTIGILTVDTMVGQDTIEQIRNAFSTLEASDVDTLVVDLRQNNGGAFAGRVLVEHVIHEPIDLGYFLSRRWWNDHSELPNQQQVAALTPWQGWSVREFWAASVEDGALRIRLQPSQTSFDGEVIVLIGPQTASAAEFTADALKSSGRARLVGETTSGQMLSQTFFDLSGGFSLALPVSDYYSHQFGRIEGVGVEPHVHVKAEDALDHVLSNLH